MVKCLFICICSSIWLFFAPKASAAFYISSVSASTINNADDVITVYATYSGSTTAKQFLQVAVRKVGETYYFGQTRNLKNEWIKYQGVDGSDFSNYSQNFYSFQATNSSWFGELKIKIDQESTNFKGPGTYLLKIFRYITAGKNESDNSIELTINVASVSAAHTTTQEDSVVTLPSISFTLPSSGILGEQFKISYSLSTFDKNGSFYVKARGVQTQNGNVSLSDNEAWTKFPYIKIADNGSYSGEVSAVVSDDKDESDYSVKLRFKRVDNDSYVESETKTIKLIKKTILEEIKISTPVAKKISTPVAIKRTASVPAVLGVVNSAVAEKTNNNSRIYMILGFGACILAMVSFLFGEEIWDIIRKLWELSKAPKVKL